MYVLILHEMQVNVLFSSIPYIQNSTSSQRPMVAIISTLFACGILIKYSCRMRASWFFLTKLLLGRLSNVHVSVLYFLLQESLCTKLSSWFRHKQEPPFPVRPACWNDESWDSPALWTVHFIEISLHLKKSRKILWRILVLGRVFVVLCRQEQVLPAQNFQLCTGFNAMPK